MDKQKWKKISHIFDLALTMPQDRRTTYIKNLCADDPELQEEINALLASVEESDKMLDEHLRNNEALLQDITANLQYDENQQSLTGATVGHWNVVELLGRGGMGDVYKVERSDSDIQQQGALKIMRRGLDTPDNVRRFRLEKQILAGLHHPNIASLIDGGVSEDGLPYLVMEYVDGEPIDEYCDNHQLTTDKRLRLFKTVCRAVQHAHKNLIIHRDLKPENILVTEEGHVKILDFGIAKLLDPDLYELSMVETHQHVRLMSMEYAAPEQITGEAITTSTDVYSLGVLLYELLAGLHPFNFEDKRFGEIEQTILHETPVKPSRRLGNSEKADSIAISRNIKKEGLKQLLRGDPDAIILKTLRKETNDRYESVSQLVDDLERYETQQPVGARLDSTRYRISKFYERHKKGMGITAAVLVIIIALVTFYTFRLAHQRNEAQREAQKSEQVQNLLIDIFQSRDPFLASRSNNVTIQQILDRGTKNVVSKLKKQPLVQAELMETLGNVYIGLVKFENAVPLLRQALAIYKKKLGKNHPSIADIYNALGLIKLRKGYYEEAELLYKRAREIYKQHYGKNDYRYASTVENLGSVYSETGRSEEAVKAYNLALKLFGEKYFGLTIGILNDRGFAQMALGRYERAAASFQRASRMAKNHYGSINYAVSNSLTGLGQIMHLRGDLVSAESLQTKALNIRKQLFEPGHTHIAEPQLRLGWVLVEQGRLREAIPMVKKAYRSFKSHLPADHWKIAASKGVLALAWIGRGKFKQAEKTLLNTHRIFLKQFGPDDYRTQSAQQALAKLYKAWGKPQKAKTYLATQ